ncbi:hypothetical protein Taro_010282 [Colocasia esculenta]|uniref:Transmembrane protein n=1 Tax=Colocasia esculenta TaxID=4460 RepID=A0A843UCK9_COLES|nr:hypothetical protein [Colocasia esculenta]
MLERWRTRRGAVDERSKEKELGERRDFIIFLILNLRIHYNVKILGCMDRNPRTLRRDLLSRSARPGSAASARRDNHDLVNGLPATSPPFLLVPLSLFQFVPIPSLFLLSSPTGHCYLLLLLLLWVPMIQSRAGLFLLLLDRFLLSQFLSSSLLFHRQQKRNQVTVAFCVLQCLRSSPIRSPAAAAAAAQWKRSVENAEIEEHRSLQKGTGFRRV